MDLSHILKCLLGWVSTVAIHLIPWIESQIHYKFSGEDKSTDCLLNVTLCSGSPPLKCTILVCPSMAMNQLTAIALQDLSPSTVSLPSPSFIYWYSSFLLTFLFSSLGFTLPIYLFSPPFLLPCLTCLCLCSTKSLSTFSFFTFSLLHCDVS